MYRVEEFRPAAGTPGSGVWRLKFDAGHEIYRGHFPGHPITPGVCIIAVVRELAEQAAGRTFHVQRVRNVKFMNIIDPEECGVVTVECETAAAEERTDCRATVHDGAGKVYAKLSLELTERAL